MFCSWRVTKKPTVVRCCLENNKRADNENLYLISLNGLCNWISFSERVPGTTGFSLANIITPPPHTRWRAFSPRVLLRMRARAHTLRIRKNYIALTARKPWQFFFTTKLSDFKSWKGQGKPAVYVFFFFLCFPLWRPSVDFVSFTFFFFPSDNIKVCITSLYALTTTIMHEAIGCAGVVFEQQVINNIVYIPITFVLYV